MVDPVVINTVIRKFLTVSRHPGFLDKPEYKDYPLEPNGEIYASSCWYESSWAFKKAQAYCVNTLDPMRNYFICSLPYQVSIMEGLLMRKQIEDEMSESDFSELSFRMESEALWIGSGENSLYKFEDIEPCRRMAYPWLPARFSEQIQDKRVHIPPKKDEEFRVMSVDIALMASKKRDNDAASIFITSNAPVARANASRRMTNVVYTENMEGMRSDDLALRVRRLFDAYDCDYLAIDTKGNGLPIVDLLMSDIVDKSTGAVYNALGCCNNDEINDRCTDKNAPKVIWSILGSEVFNSQCALGLRESFRNGSVRLLQSDYDCDATLSQLSGFSKLSPEQRQDFRMPYIHTTLLVNELVNLQVEQKGSGAVRVYEKSGMRKDRYSSLSYNLYVVREIERQLSKPKNDMATLAEMIDFRQPQLI